MSEPNVTKRKETNVVQTRPALVTYERREDDFRGPEIEAELFEPKASLRRPAIVGLSAIIFGFGGFLLWSIVSNVDSAAVAYGNIITDSKTKTITHLEGGILKSVLVREGDKVIEGQPLIALDDTRASSDVASLTGARAGLLARLARLRAEQANKSEIEFPAALTEDGSALANSVMSDERLFFDQRRSIYGARIEAAQKQIEQTVAQANAFAAQQDAAEKQRVLVADQLARVRTLVDKGLSTEREASGFAAQLSQLIGNAGQYAAEKAKAEQQKAEAEVALLSVQMEWHGIIASDIQDTQLKLNETEQRLAIAKDVRDRLIVRAPQGGTVLNIQVRASGSAVAAGAPILEIAPDDDSLIVEARLRPMDIDAVHVGRPVAVRLTAYNMRTHPPLDGSLSYVAADQTEDAQRGVAFYTVRATIDADSLAAHPSMKLHAGMPAELVVKIEPRRAIDYILDPLTQTFYRAFREE